MERCRSRTAVLAPSRSVRKACRRNQLLPGSGRLRTGHPGHADLALVRRDRRSYNPPPLAGRGPLPGVSRECGLPSASRARHHPWNAHPRWHGRQGHASNLARTGLPDPPLRRAQGLAHSAHLCGAGDGSDDASRVVARPERRTSGRRLHHRSPRLRNGSTPGIGRSRPWRIRRDLG